MDQPAERDRKRACRRRQRRHVHVGPCREPAHAGARGSGSRLHRLVEPCTDLERATRADARAAPDRAGSVDSQPGGHRSRHGLDRRWRTARAGTRGRPHRRRIATLSRGALHRRLRAPHDRRLPPRAHAVDRPAVTARGPLDGLIVADLSRVLAGPYCTMLLADMGATVIKVESPAGDETRTWTPPDRDGVSTYYLSINRNKRSVVHDFNDRGDVELTRWLLR